MKKLKDPETILGFATLAILMSYIVYSLKGYGLSLKELIVIGLLHFVVIGPLIFYYIRSNRKILKKNRENGVSFFSRDLWCGEKSKYERKGE